MSLPKTGLSLKNCKALGERYKGTFGVEPGTEPGSKIIHMTSDGLNDTEREQAIKELERDGYIKSDAIYPIKKLLTRKGVETAELMQSTDTALSELIQKQQVIRTALLNALSFPDNLNKRRHGLTLGELANKTGLPQVNIEPNLIHLCNLKDVTFESGAGTTISDADYLTSVTRGHAVITKAGMAKL